MNLIFLCGRFRSGSTFLWNLFRQTKQITALYEPLHEQLPIYISLDVKPQKSHFFMDDYFSEYQAIAGLSDKHFARFGVTKLHLEQTDEFPEMMAYFENLFSQCTHENPILVKENRLGLRIGWIRKNFPSAKVLYLWRSPRSEWVSMLHGYPFLKKDALQEDPYLITTWSRDLAQKFPFLKAVFLRHLYQRHYFLWKLSYLAGTRQADKVVRYEDILETPKNHIQSLMDFAGIDIKDSINFYEKLVVQRPQNTWRSYAEENWFFNLEQECESMLDSFGLNENFGKLSLHAIIQNNKRYQDIVGASSSEEIYSLQEDLIFFKNQLLVKEETLQDINTQAMQRDFLLKQEHQSNLKLQDATRTLQEQSILLHKLERVGFLGVYRSLSALYYKVKFLATIYNLLQLREKMYFNWTIANNGKLKSLKFPKSYLNVKKTPSLLSFSIVIPSYNQSEYIERTIKSVLSQNYSNIELVIKDGGSTDGTTETLKKYSSRCKSIISLPDAGQANGINIGFLNTGGEIMGYLNSDDILLPGALHYVADYFNTHPETDVVYGNRIFINKNDLEIDIWALPSHDPKVLYYADYVPQETLFWRRSIWEKVGGKINETFDFAMDWDLLLQFQQMGARIVHVNRFLGAFRVHENQKSTRLLQVGLEEGQRIRFRLHQRNLSDKEIYSNLRNFYFRANLCYFMEKLFRYFRKQEIFKY